MKLATTIEAEYRCDYAYHAPLCENEGLLYQDIDVSQCVEPKQFHDVVGFDIFDRRVTRKRLARVTFTENWTREP